jgi:hypothetical protein
VDTSDNLTLTRSFIYLTFKPQRRGVTRDRRRSMERVTKYQLISPLSDQYLTMRWTPLGLLGRFLRNSQRQGVKTPRFTHGLRYIREVSKTVLTYVVQVSWSCINTHTNEFLKKGVYQLHVITPLVAVLQNVERAKNYDKACEELRRQQWTRKRRSVPTSWGVMNRALADEEAIKLNQLSRYIDRCWEHFRLSFR